MIFNKGDPGHRRLLAHAIQDFLQQPGATTSGKDSPTSPSLEAALERVGCSVARGTLGRLGNIDITSDNDDAYASQETASRVAGAMRKLGWWPGDDLGRSLRLVPAVFDGFDPKAWRILEEFTQDDGAYVSYQFSNRIPANILIGRFTVGPLTPWRHCTATNYIEKTGTTANSLTLEGVTWSDSNQNIYMLLRAGTYSFPSFILLDDIARPKGKGMIETIKGTVLGGARQNSRHLSSICLHKAPYPDDDSAITPDQHDRLPPSVRAYMTMPLKNGPSNY